MLEDTVGEEAIQKGIHHYLDQHKFDNAVTNDLWSAIETKWTHTPEQKMYNFTVQELMDTWTLQMGYPLVTFNKKNESENRYTIRQQRFFKAAAVSSRFIAGNSMQHGIFFILLYFTIYYRSMTLQSTSGNWSRTISGSFPSALKPTWRMCQPNCWF